ncbi:MAG TPA: M1 family aminopeptidase [Chitinophagaceae bacterium]|nr:M1 family aminopeptidase [Chitinophagaceae bacterium]
MKKTIFLFISVLSVLAAQSRRQPAYLVKASPDKRVHVQAGFALDNDTIFIFARGTTPELPEGEAGFVKNLVVKDVNGRDIAHRYAGDGNWILAGIQPGQWVEITYELLTTHKQYNWDHVGGVDEAAFTNDDGLFFTGYSLFILPGMDMKNIELRFDLPSGWKASTPWQQKDKQVFTVPDSRLLVNNCLMLGKHKEALIKVGNMEMRLAIAGKIAYALPLVQKTMQRVLAAYQSLFKGSPAPVYLVAMSDERMTDGSAFRGSFSQIFADTIDEKGIATWGYIMAHEIFHLWNGHALIPERQEEWFKEGFTDYMTNLVLRKAGLITDETMSRKLEHMARRYWLDRMWQRDTLSIQQTGEQKEKFRFGVYGGGAVVAIALEVEMRRATGMKKGVADLMTKMFEDFAGKNKRYSLPDIIAAVNEITGKNLRPFFDRYVTGKEFLDLKPYLAEMGLDFYTVIEEVFVTPNKKATAGQKAMYRKIFIQP